MWEALILIEEVVKAILASGPLAAVLFLVWKLERDDRIAKDKKIEELGERALKGLHDATSAVKELTDAIAGKDLRDSGRVKR